MPRVARQKSETGIYHCILRGVDKRDIFLDNQDRQKFMKEIRITKEKYDYEVYAYCLMDNHVHILLKDKKEHLHKLMHDLVLKYSIYFNGKYERVGHLFQNRYLSKPVETESYLLVLQRYIHQNPKYMKSYQWSSYQEYVTNKNDIVNSKFILGFFDSDEKIAIDKFRSFNEKRMVKVSIKEYKEFEMIRNLSDEEALTKIKEILNLDNILSIKRYNTKLRNEYIKRILSIEGVTIGQLSRIIEINKTILIRIKKEMDKTVTPVPKGDKCHRWETSPKEELDGEGK